MEKELSKSYRETWIRRQVAIAILGDRCQECKMDDRRALQILPSGTGKSFFGRVIKDPRGFDLLCANCAQIKRAADVPQAWRAKLDNKLDRLLHRHPLDRLKNY